MSICRADAVLKFAVIRHSTKPANILRSTERMDEWKAALRIKLFW